MNLVLPAPLQAALAAQGVLASAARYFTNGLDTRTRGIDLVSTYRQDWHELGRSDFTLAYNRNRTEVQGVARNPDVLAANALTLIDHQTIGRATEASPSSKLSAAVDQSIGAWSARLAETRYGSFVVPQNTLALEQKYRADWVLDASAGWKGGAWNGALGVDNLTDRYPARIISAGNLDTSGIFKYSNFSPFGFNGRQYYARAGYSW